MQVGWCGGVGYSSAAGFKSLVICILGRNWISNRFEIAAPANHLIALVLPCPWS